MDSRNMHCQWFVGGSKEGSSSCMDLMELPGVFEFELPTQ